MPQTVILNKTVFCGVHISRHACPGQTINSPIDNSQPAWASPQWALAEDAETRSLALHTLVPLRVECDSR